MEKSTIAILIGMAISFLGQQSWADSDWHERLAADKAKIGITDAVKLVKEKYNGEIIDIEIDDFKNSVVYEVKFIDIQNKRKVKLKIDMNTGAILKEKSRRVLFWNKEDNAEYLASKSVRENNFGLLEAIDMVQQQIDGKVSKAELKHKIGITVIEVEMLTKNGIEKMVVDVSDRKIITHAAID